MSWKDLSLLSVEWDVKLSSLKSVKPLRIFALLKYSIEHIVVFIFCFILYRKCAINSCMHDRFHVCEQSTVGIGV